jgi:predicted phage terminase large subunit-like protein
MNPKLLNPNHEKLEEFSNLLIKNDFGSFLTKCFATVNPGTEYKHNWHIDLIAEHLMACEKNDIKRLIINIPPRHLKSLSVNVAWPAWLLGQNPARRIISASYSQQLATKHSIDSRLIINSSWYRNIFPNTRIVNDQNEKDKFLTTKRGFRLATSVGGTLTGEGGNFLILDDPHNPAHMYSTTMREQTLSWYEQVFASRLDDKEKGVIVLIMQRLHEQDLTGHLLTKNYKNWEHLNIPALADRTTFYPSPLKKYNGYLYPEKFPLHPDKENLRSLKNTEAEIGSFTFSAQYMQNPLPTENGLISRNWLKYYRNPPDKFQTITQSWDTAIRVSDHNDYTVCTTWGESDNAYYLLDVMRDRLEYSALKHKIINMAEKWLSNSILIEDRSSGQSLIQDIKLETKLPIIAINPRGDKFMRLAQISSMVESGKVLFPERSSFMSDLEVELLSFPHSPHDDQVDSLTQFLNWIKSKKAFVPAIRRL